MSITFSAPVRKASTNEANPFNYLKTFPIAAFKQHNGIVEIKDITNPENGHRFGMCYNANGDSATVMISKTVKPKDQAVVISEVSRKDGKAIHDGGTDLTGYLIHNISDSNVNGTW